MPSEMHKSGNLPWSLWPFSELWENAHLGAMVPWGYSMPGRFSDQ